MGPELCLRLSYTFCMIKIFMCSGFFILKIRNMTYKDYIGKHVFKVIRILLNLKSVYVPLILIELYPDL